MRGNFLNKYKSHIILLASLALAVLVAWPATVFAQSAGLDEFAAVTRLGTGTDLISMTARIINIVLSILGVLVIGIVIYGGWLWLTSRGNEEQIAKAKKVIANGLIGLIIILTSFAIASFVLLKLAEATGAHLGGEGPPPCVGVGCLPEGGEKGFNVVSTSPKHLANNVSLCRDVQAIFNQDLDPATIDSSSFIVEESGGPAVTGTYNTGTNSASFIHAADFKENTDYIATITQDVKNIPPPGMTAKNLEVRKEWLFKTGNESDNTLPQVDVDDGNPKVYPTAGLGDVCRNPAIQAVFTEEMRVSSFNTDNIILTNSVGTVIPLKRVYAGSDFESFTVYPAATLASHETFRVTLKTDSASHPNGITDTCSNPLDGNEDGAADGTPADDYFWEFTTGENEDCNPEITSVNPIAEDYSAVVEITGRNFGITGDASFNGWWADANSFLPLTDNIVCWGAAACSTAQDTVRVKVPVGSTTGAWYQQDNYKASVGRVWLALGGKATNKLEFTVKSPYINRLSPAAGGVGQFVTIMGWNFGNIPGRVTLNGIDVGPPASCSNWWKDTRIVVQIPASAVAGSSYDFQIITAADLASPNPQVAENKNKRSNYELFQVTSDAPGPGICDIIPDNKLDTDPPVEVTVTGEHFGASKGSSQLLFGTAATSPTTWSDSTIITNTPALTAGEYDVCATVGGKTSNCELFSVIPESSSGVINRPPQVVRSNVCAVDTQSPNPYINTTNVCINALVSARFTEVMQASSFNDSNIQLYQCSNDGALDSTTCTGVVTLSSFTPLKNSSDEVVGFTADPVIDYANGYWYKGLIKKNVLSAAGVPMVADYPWYWRASGSNCALDKVMLSPASANLPGVGSTQDFTALATDAKCHIFVSPGWTWEKGNDPTDPPPDRINFTATSANTATIEGLSPTIGEPAWVTAATAGKVSKPAPVKVGSTVGVVPTEPPFITSMTPTDGRAQAGLTTVVTIKGGNFGSSGKVKFGGTIANPAACGSWSNDEIIIAAPPLTTGVTYNVIVETNLGSSDTSTEPGAITPTFLVNDVILPGICSMTPDFGPGGTNISIRGYNFSDSATNGQIIFPIYSSGVASTTNPTPTSWSNTAINFKVPNLPDLPRTNDPALFEKGVYVTVDYGAGIKESNDKRFFGEPFITSVTPVTGPTGSGVTIRGGNFGPNVGVVKFNGVNSDPLPPVCPVTAWSNTQIVAKAPSAGSTGLVTVTTAVPPGLTTSAARSKTFTYDASLPLAPTFCSLAPANVVSVPFSPINLAGDNFGDPKGADDQVNFANKVITAVSSWMNSNIILGAPADTTSGDVTVQKDIAVIVRKCLGVVIAGICIGGEADVTETRTVVSNPLAFTVGEVGGVGGVGDLHIINFTPADGSANICRNTALAVKLDKVLDKSTVTAANVQVQPQTQINMKVESGTATCASGCLGANCNGTWSEVYYPNGWQQLIQTVTPSSSGTCSIRLVTRLTPGYVYYDDVSAVKVSDPTVNLLSNGDFESGMGEWESAGGNWSVASGLAKTGSRSLLNIRTDAEINQVRRTFDVTAGTNYVVRVWVFAGIPGKVSASALDASGDGVLDTGQVTFSPASPLIQNHPYRLRVSGNLKALDGSTLDCSVPANCMSSFTTGSNICQINKVTITPPEWSFTKLGVTRNFAAQALAPDGNPLDPLAVNFTWSENDAANVVAVTPPLSSDNIDVGANNKNGRATLEVTADGSALGAGVKKTSAPVDVFLCEDPYYYEDSTYNFNFRYCLAQTIGGAALPKLLGPISPTDPVTDSTKLKELLFNIDGTNDVIGLRVYTNPDRLTPAEWLKEKQGSTATLTNTTVDGFAAATGGQTVYVSGLNVTSGNNIYANEFLLSLNQQAGVAARQIFEQLVDSWQFNINLIEKEQQQMQADFKRLLDRKIIRDLLDRYAVLHDYTVPQLVAGSYIPGLSTSKWNSWQQTLSSVLGRSLPTDPLNSFGTCADHDPASCWNESTKDFLCPAESYVYRYRAVNNQTARLYFNPEFVKPGEIITWRGNPEISVPGSDDPVDKCSGLNDTVWEEIDYNNPVLSVSPTITGVVKSGDSKINCGGSCSAAYSDNKKCSAIAATNAGGVCDADADCGGTVGACLATPTQVVLTATPAAGYRFSTWSGCDPPATEDCHVKMVGSKNISALFTAVTYTLTINKEGLGTVQTIAPDGSINCGAGCTATTYDYSGGPTVHLEAIPDSGYVFAGWGGSCTGVGTCNVVIGTNKTVGAKFIPTYQLQVSSVGPGTVISNPAGISCGASCTLTLPKDTNVTLTPVAGGKGAFVNWGGNCTGNGSCTLVMDSNKNVEALFETVILKYNLNVARAGTGTGLVTSNIAGDGGGINCGSNCSDTYSEETDIILTASPGVGSDFDGWTVNGSDTTCPGLAVSCPINNISSNQNIVAKFKPKTFLVSIAKIGAGAASGTVKSDPAGINCGATCNKTYVYGDTVVFTPYPVTPYVFTEWGGDVECGGARTCSIIVIKDFDITARFDKTFKLTVKTNGGSGLGNVVSTPKGLNGVAISCGADCVDDFIASTPIVLTATAAGGSSFAGWSDASCPGLGSCTINSASDLTVTATFNVVPISYQLKVTLSGTGAGNVQSTPSGINCGVGGAVCAAYFEKNKSVTLTPYPLTGSSFTNWAGECSGASCTVPMDKNYNVEAVFTADSYTLFVNVAPVSGGTVTSDVGGIKCPTPVCSASYSYGSNIILKAVPQANYKFDGWSGGCGGVGDCSLTMGVSNISVTANFSAITYELTVEKDGTGSGTVVSSPAGINMVCNPSCGIANYSYIKDTVVTLTATATGGSGLAGWVDCDSSPAPDKCVVTMSSNKPVRINFSPPAPVSYTVTTAVSAGGTVTATGINCPGDCSESFVTGTAVTLSANQSAGYVFKRWAGDECNGSTNPSCAFTVNSAKNVAAEFAFIWQLRITLAGGSGNVTTNPVGTSCGANCYEFADGLSVSMTATGAAGYNFKNWTVEAASCGSTNPCSITMTANKNVTVNFEASAPLTHTYNLVAGWNLVSLPFNVANSTWNVVFPNAAQVPTKIIAGVNISAPNLEIGYSFWLKNNITESLTINASSTISTYSIAFPKGWNGIGSLSTPVPVTNITASVGSWSGLNRFDGAWINVGAGENINPGVGYTLNLSADATLTLTK